MLNMPFPCGANGPRPPPPTRLSYGSIEVEQALKASLHAVGAVPNRIYHNPFGSRSLRLPAMLPDARRTLGSLLITLAIAPACSDAPERPDVNTGTTTSKVNTSDTVSSTSASATAGDPSTSSAPKQEIPDGVVLPGPMTGGPAKRCGELPFDQAWFRARVARLSGAADAVIQGETLRLGERFTPEGRRLAREWIKAQYQALGYTVEDDPFTEGTSVVAYKAGINPTYYVVSSHYDTVTGSPGADDDATGVVTGLAIAAALAPCKLDHGVKFIAFDQEERKMTGAYHFARTEANARRAQQILGDIQVEMTGYDADGDGAFNIVHCDKPMNKSLTKAVEDAVKAHNLPLYPQGGCTSRSDHQAFWSIDRPAIAVSELFFADVPDRTPCYHQDCDTYDKVNFKYMHQLAIALTHAVLKLSGAR